MTDTFVSRIAKAQLLSVTLAGFDQSDRLIGMRWSNAIEEVVSVDVDTAAITPVGQMGDLSSWTMQSAISADGGTLYALGFDPADGAGLYTFDLVTDAFVSKRPNAELGGVSLSGFDSGNRLIGMRWSGASEDVVSIDLGTGVVTTIGDIGDLSTWTLQSAISTDGHTLYALGYDPADAEALYVFDLATNTFVSKLPHGGLMGVSLAGFGRGG